MKFIEKELNKLKFSFFLKMENSHFKGIRELKSRFYEFSHFDWRFLEKMKSQ